MRTQFTWGHEAHAPALLIYKLHSVLITYTPLRTTVGTRAVLS